MNDAVTAPARAALPEGATVLTYRVEALLGAGGFGITYLARDLHAGRQIALKEYFPAELAARAPDGRVVVGQATAAAGDAYRRGLDRFLAQARALASFGHPHVVSVLTSFEANGTGYMAMEYEEGESLGHLLKRVHTLSEERLRSIALPLLDALRAIHDAGFLHGDLKPTNVFLRHQGGPMLIDFGERRFGAGAGAVTPGYAPVEQYAGEGGGPWSDIYAFAAVCYRAVTGDHPPDARSRRRRDPVRGALASARSSYGAHWLACIGWGLEVDRRRRPQSVQAWMEGFEGGTVPYRLPGHPAKARGRAPRETIAPYRWIVPVVIALAVVAWRAYEKSQASLEPAPAHALRESPAAGLSGGHAAKPPATLVGTVRERPSRERTSRPGRER